jgi:hypothetical protein
MVNSPAQPAHRGGRGQKITSLLLSAVLWAFVPGSAPGFGILFRFQIAELDFARRFCFFPSLRLLIHTGVSVDGRCIGSGCSEVYSPKSGARLRGVLEKTADYTDVKDEKRSLSRLHAIGIQFRG